MVRLAAAGSLVISAPCGHHAILWHPFRADEMSTSVSPTKTGALDTILFRLPETGAMNRKRIIKKGRINRIFMKSYFEALMINIMTFSAGNLLFASFARIHLP
ncbi:MAG: hypothetical protein LUP97_02695 [Methanoregula sp.]|nr:hypothetical protein [Methanoregula sp.]